MTIPTVHALVQDLGSINLSKLFEAETLNDATNNSPRPNADDPTELAAVKSILATRLSVPEAARSYGVDPASLERWVDEVKAAAALSRRRAPHLLDPLRIFLGVSDRDETVGAPRPGQPRADFLRDEIRRLRRRRARLAQLSRAYLILGVCLLIGSIVFYWATTKKEAWLGALYSIPFLLTPLVRSTRGQDTDILALESELDLVEATAITPEQRAEKLFKNHQFELQKYYDQTLRHSKWIFVVGVVCIFLGFATIATTFLLVVKPPSATTLQEKILVASLGGIGSVLANFIAVIYLRMFSEILQSVTAFHNRLVSTHNLYFANFMSTKVGDETRDGIVSEIARNLTHGP